MTSVFGALILLFGMVFGLVSLFRKSTAFKNPGWIVGITLITGFGLMLSHRITEFTIPNVGTLKAATEQATADAETIAKLKERVENQSATVDMVAAQAKIAKDLSERAQKQTALVEQRSDELKIAFMDATATLTKLKSEEEFLMLVVSAQSDDRASYDRLNKIAGEKENPFAALAATAWLTIYDAHNGPFSQSDFKVPWKEGVDPGKLTFTELKVAYDNASAPIKPSIL